MKILSSLKSTFKLVSVATAVIAATSLTNCGGGSASEGNVTVRPKTLDGLKLSFPGGTAVFDFTKGRSSATAENNGDVETGSAVYSSNNFDKDFITLGGKNMEVFFPKSVSEVSYVYTSVNDNSAELRITAAAPIYSDNGLLESDDTESSIYWHLFSRGGNNSYYDPVTDTFIEVDLPRESTIVINLNFEDAGGNINNLSNFQFAPESVLYSDSYYVESSFFFFFGQNTLTKDDMTAQTSAQITTIFNTSVPPGYNSVNSDSTLASSSLSGKTLVCTPEASSGNPSFTVDFTSTSASEASAKFSQTGTYFVRYEDDTIEPDTGTYDYILVEDSDSAVLTLEGGSAIDGVWVLAYTSIETASQSGSGTYTNVTQSGKFTLKIPTTF